MFARRPPVHPSSFSFVLSLCTLCNNSLKCISRLLGDMNFRFKIENSDCREQLCLLFEHADSSLPGTHRTTMRGVEEIAKGRDSGLYFSSLYHQNPSGGVGRRGASNANFVNSRSGTPAGDATGGIAGVDVFGGNGASRSSEGGGGGGGGGMSIAARQAVTSSSVKRKRVNYNIQQIQAEQFLTARPKSKSIGEELEAELIDSTGNKNAPVRRSNISVAELKKAQRRFEELNRENYNENVRIEIPKNVTGLVVKRNTNAGAVVKRLLISKKGWSNFADELNKNELKLVSNDGPLEVKPNAFQIEKLCTICGGVSYSSCIKCRARVCSVKCQNIHNETRCTHF